MAAGRVAGPASAAGAALGSGAADFEALLRKAATGSAASGLAVEIDPSADVQLSDDQTQRLSAAADMARSQGFDRALVLLDGQGLVLEVAQRRVVGRVDPAEVGAVGDIDGVVAAPASADAAPLAEIKGAAAEGASPGRLTAGDALLRMLDRSWDRPAERHAAR